jgi:uncharacterized integral membrane protein (TIGR00698 family)
MKISEHRSNMLHGVLLIALFSCAAFWIADTELIRSLSLSPLIVGIVLGMLYANSLRNRLPATWVPGILFCSKRLLRIGIILYGFNLTFQDILAVGIPALVIDTIIVATTICGGILLGKLLKMDRGIALLTAVGSGICGAAAVLGAEATIRTKPYKTAVAVSTVVIFGTLAMFLYPALYRSGMLQLDPAQMGLYTGATLHEVAHVVGAGNAMGNEVAGAAIIVKMIRVILLVPVLLLISFSMARLRARKLKRRGKTADTSAEGGKVSIPWFAIGFLGVIAFNSLGLLPAQAIGWIKNLDVFLLTMAMTALGAETSIEKFKRAGVKPFILAALLFVWLMVGGWMLAKYAAPWLM